MLGQANARGEAYRCAECGGEMNYDATSQAMRCHHCGHCRQVPQAEGERAVVEYDLEHGLAMASARGYGAAVRTTQCQECGASVSFGDSVTSTRCDFCGSPQVLEQTANRNVIQPESLVPFQVDRDGATDRFSGWLKGLWFRPSSLKNEARVSEMSGVYVPYWTFDADVRSDWTAQAGYYYYETETYTERDSQGNEVVREREVRRIRWEPAWGSRRDHFDDLLVCASGGLPRDMAERLRTFDTGSLQPYNPQFLVGWKAEEYAVELNDAWKQAVERMIAEQRRRCSGDVPGDTHRFLHVSNQFSHEKFKHVLLPIWISAYRYKDQVYRFLVNGQTGEVTGKAPYSALKIALFILVIAAIIAGVVLMVQRGQ